jgi:hypothetical protein
MSWCRPKLVCLMLYIYMTVCAQLNRWLVSNYPALAWLVWLDGALSVGADEWLEYYLLFWTFGCLLTIIFIFTWSSAVSVALMDRLGEQRTIMSWMHGHYCFLMHYTFGQSGWLTWMFMTWFAGICIMYTIVHSTTTCGYDMHCTYHHAPCLLLIHSPDHIWNLC